MIVVEQIFRLLGSVSFILYGMKIMSDGIQKSASDKLHKTLEFINRNRVMAVLIGVVVTAIVQSSGATSVMAISFVNAELLSLPQAIAVIFGANIGTTATAWMVTLVDFSFNLSAIALPAFGIGYFLTFFKRLKNKTWAKQSWVLACCFWACRCFRTLLQIFRHNTLRFWAASKAKVS